MGVVMATKHDAIQRDRERYVDVREAAQILHLSEASVRRLLTQRKLRRFKCGARTLLAREQVLSLIRAT
jgi:excisionase family DNA binding protein